MTPEEIEELRALVVRLNGDNMAAILGAALEHIDQQAASLDEAEALTRRNVELINGYMARITELEAQVAALQEIAVEERAKRIYKGKFRSLNFELPADRKTHIDDARHQLAKEHPEAFR